MKNNPCPKRIYNPQVNKMLLLLVLVILVTPILSFTVNSYIYNNNLIYKLTFKLIFPLISISLKNTKSEKLINNNSHDFI